MKKQLEEALEKLQGETLQVMNEWLEWVKMSFKMGTSSNSGTINRLFM